MKLSDRNTLLKTLLGAGLYLLDPLRDRLANRMEDMSDKAQDTYDTAAERFDRATRAIRGEEDHHVFGTAAAFLIGIGVGVGVGLLFAPASGEETRSTIASRVQDVSDNISGRVQGVSEKVKSQFSSGRTESSTGTYGQ
jgi:hypothetical protein